MYSRETRVLLRHYLEQGVGKLLNWPGEQLHVRDLPGDVGPGNALTITVEYESVIEAFTGFGEKGKNQRPPGDVGRPSLAGDFATRSAGQVAQIRANIPALEAQRTTA